MRIGMKVVVCSLTVASLTSCSGLVQHSVLGSDEGGYVSINTDAEGMRALSDWQTGTINEARTPEGVKSSYFQLREGQELERTKRFGIRFSNNKGEK